MIHHVVPHRTTLMKSELASANVKVAHTADLPYFDNPKTSSLFLTVQQSS